MMMEKEAAKPKTMYGEFDNQWFCCVLRYGKRHSLFGVLSYLFLGNYSEMYLGNQM